MKQARKLLKPDGVVALIIPKTEADRWIGDGQAAGLKVARICHVFTLAHKEAARVMIEFAFVAAEEAVMETLLIESDTGEYSEDYKELTTDFYTKWSKKKRL
jgi:tRNA1Val (adenine37-N6)-methyltransferase